MCAAEAAPEIDLERFLEAQEDNGAYERAKREMIAGAKTSHWIWYVFPQIQKLEKTSKNNIFYAIRSLAEAKAYLDHHVLGPRLVELTEIVLSHMDIPIDVLMGWKVDSRKFKSCMTLFSLVSEPGSVFHRALDQVFGGERCDITVTKMAPPAAPDDA
jgi:uncharacterized protein (DUF1810 family)